MAKFTLNGESRVVEVAADTPVLWVLRDNLQLMGTKFGCGMAMCGACTIHLDGQAVRSCVLPVSEIEGKSITTIEGLAKDGVRHPLQQAWIDENVPQCGYCQSGQLMSAAAMIAKTPHPTEGDVDRCLSGNLCRCGMYPRIKKAIARATDASVASADLVGIGGAK